MQVNIKEYAAKIPLFIYGEDSWANTTAKKRYLKAMKENPNATVLFRCGRFFEAFYSSAETLHKVLDLPYDGGKVPHTGFPSNQLYESLKRLRKGGRRSIRII
jgi:DNA mismatch repair ATPase MutS